MDADKEPLQETPKGAKIPVPTRAAVLGNLARAARPKRRNDASDNSGSGPEDEDGEHSRS